MERLTIWNEQTEMAELIDWDTEEWKEFMSDFDVPVQISLGVAIDKLAHYEDLEEQGLLLKLPCKVGGVVYVIAQAFDMENNTTRYKVFIRHIDQIRGNKLNPVYFVTDGGDSFVPSSIGNRVFLTKEEAEAKLKELENE